MKIILLSLFVGYSVFAQQDPKAEAQAKIDQFIAEHEVVETKVYCRDGIATAECRTLMTYRNKKTLEKVPSFQIAFSAPTRQAGGTEFFLKISESANLYSRYMDSTINKKVDIDEVGENLTVVADGSSIIIKDIKFGAITADLSFDNKKALLKGFQVDPTNSELKTPIEISYGFFGRLGVSAFFPEGKVWTINKIVNGIPANVKLDLTVKGTMTQSFTCNHSNGTVQTASVSAPVTITDSQIINLESKTHQVTDSQGNWCQVIIPVRTMNYKMIDEKTIFITGDPNNPGGINWIKL